MKRTLMVVLAVVILILIICCGVFDRYEKEAISAAESYVAGQIYNDYGRTADEIKSFILYHGNDADGDAIHLVVARCYRDGIEIGSYCVYTKLGTFRNSTNILPSGYNFDKNINSLKSMFGIFD